MDAFWSVHELPFDGTRTKRWTADDKEQAAFMYVAAVDMCRRGYLDESLGPKESVTLAARAANEAFLVPYDVQIRNAFPSEPDGAGASADVTPAALIAEAPQPPAPPPPPPPRELPVVNFQVTPREISTVTNFKGVLNELFPRGHGHEISYDSLETTTDTSFGRLRSGHFVSTVTVNGASYQAAGPAGWGKKAAEHAVAREVLLAIGALYLEESSP